VIVAGPDNVCAYAEAPQPATAMTIAANELRLSRRTNNIAIALHAKHQALQDGVVVTVNFSIADGVRAAEQKNNLSARPNTKQSA
jgi:hypothetical protein